ncbi:hypothetical protein F5Y19DRAFT_411833 [Xylariaceae sp. FL1651]|nr:hypothetical protein F5Y19DRAFT_411833 [Xylariaceae sp. FL1651]
MRLCRSSSTFSPSLMFIPRRRRAPLLRLVTIPDGVLALSSMATSEYVKLLIHPLKVCTVLMIPIPLNSCSSFDVLAKIGKMLCPGASGSLNLSLNTWYSMIMTRNAVSS